MGGLDKGLGQGLRGLGLHRPPALKLRAGRIQWDSGCNFSRHEAAKLSRFVDHLYAAL
jgi:hypothetical protein